ncbi:MAG: 16S rRNA (guanine(966)-N(2))-methyltransferase RsmD [Chloroflexi bacterium]|nr:16S rRNA (guanine(966)-N(2))-methyltransferase RsmD [Chloroflexota bacterium]MDE2935261.1 16S rRNA (guanine(966)-N(2))-methyltransferase RsmD [Chloroflexota bacterium]MXX67152.1 16S rRNA (guanine(966)-N(2))-methyltransferase RsmD [Chloroflexota bacterium]MXY01119.1 16S rRNA (guanine(966)-N(2))-methyltransferase RsmD [Chloroflexota bacterium]MYB16368.1 16S rRNA (guanine(966)-N(2))-methyltransferase RsmD [Chloroflexota bacterium]
MARLSLRITGGKLRGRVLRSSRDAKIRPTSAKVRESLFNVIGPVEGLRIADLYCGSGALGFEALSRGAAEVVAVDRSRMARQMVLGNLAQLEDAVEGRCRFIGSSVERWIDEFAGGPPFDLVLMDPPYAQLDAAMDALAAIIERGLLGRGGLAVLEHSARSTVESAGREFRICGNYRYGDSALTLVVDAGSGPDEENGNGN